MNFFAGEKTSPAKGLCYMPANHSSKAKGYYIAEKYICYEDW